jgi:hypothetical protein
MHYHFKARESDVDWERSKSTTALRRNAVTAKQFWTRETF